MAGYGCAAPRRAIDTHLRRPAGDASVRPLPRAWRCRDESVQRTTGLGVCVGAFVAMSLLLVTASSATADRGQALRTDTGSAS